MSRVIAVAAHAIERARCADERAWITRDPDDRARAEHYTRRAWRLIDDVALATGHTRREIADAILDGREVEVLA